MSLFTKNRLMCIKVFIEKHNWKPTLNYLRNRLLQNDFFFFFDSERGQNLIIFTEYFHEDFIVKLQNYIDSLPRHYVKQPEDFLFANFKDKSIIIMNKVCSSKDIQIPADVKDGLILQKQIANVLIGALNYNDFFIEEKNRINLALQLVFLSMIKADHVQIRAAISKSTDQQIVDEGLKSFYEEIQEIEKDGHLEKWVKDWLDVSASIQSVSKLEFIVESLCQALEIRAFTANILQTLYSILLSQRIG
jgi:hypothetical protein